MVYIDRVSNLQSCDFWQMYYQRQIPVVIENAALQYPAMNWSLQSMKEIAGHNIVTVRQNTSNQEYHIGKKYTMEKMTFSNYIENIENNTKKSHNIYLAVQNIKKALPELEKDVLIPEYVQKIHNGPYLWVANKGHYEFCHFDPDDNFLIVFSGQKDVKLYPAADLDCLYPNELGSKGKSIQSVVDMKNPDFLMHPKYKKTECYECSLKAGDMLFFPAFWMHQVTSPEITISMNIFFGDHGSNTYLTKLLTGNQWPACKYWFLNVIEQNRVNQEYFQKLLQNLPDTIYQFLKKLWHEEASEEQIEVFVSTVLEYCELDRLPVKIKEYKNPPVLKIRGLRWRS